MNINNIWKVIFTTTLCVLILDFTWIYFRMKDEYRTLIKTVQHSEMTVRMIPAMISYMTIILSIILFTLPHIRPTHRLLDSMYYGGIQGLMMYGMFSFTNYSLIKDWSPRVVALDTLWGFVLYTIVSYIVSSMYL